jgi:PAS domain S-box-containing protein
MGAAIEESARNLTAFRLEYRVIHPDQSVHWILAQSMPERLSDGSTVWSGFNTDITERKLAEMALAEKVKLQEQMRAIVTSLDDIVFEVDEDGTYLNLWTANEAMLVQTREQVTGRRFDEVFGTEAGRPYYDVLRRVLESDAPETLEYRLELGGEQRWFAAHYSPIRVSDQERRTVSILVRDISARKQAEELVYAQRDLARIIGMGVAPLEAWPRCLDIVLRVSGLDSGGIYLLDAEHQRSELVYHHGLGAGFARAVASYPWDAPNGPLGQSGQNSYLDTAELARQRIPYEEGLRAAAILPMSSQGRVIGAVVAASHTDPAISPSCRQALETIVAEIGGIAIHLRAEAALRQREEQQRLILDHLPVAVVLADLAGNAYYQNLWFFELIGYTAEQVPTLESWAAAVFPDPVYREAMITEWNRRLIAAQEARSEAAPMEMLVTCADAREKHLLLTARSIDELFFITLIDITERKKAEALLEARVRERTEQLRRSEESLRATNLELQRAARVKDEFLANMSHELRTPLTGVMGISEALRHNTYGSLNEKQLNALATIEKSGQHLLVLINDILDITRLDAGKLELQMEPCALEEVCQASLQLIRGTAQKKHHNIRFTMAPAMLSITGDARRLKQILVNLLAMRSSSRRSGACSAWR